MVSTRCAFLSVHFYGIWRSGQERSIAGVWVAFCLLLGTWLFPLVLILLLVSFEAACLRHGGFIIDRAGLTLYSFV
jgi:hypothetical protein